MQRVEIARANGYRIISIGNGTAYEFGRNGGSPLFFQGDDATEFREQWDEICEVFPNLHTGACLEKLAGLYS